MNIFRKIGHRIITKIPTLEFRVALQAANFISNGDSINSIYKCRHSWPDCWFHFIAYWQVFCKTESAIMCTITWDMRSAPSAFVLYYILHFNDRDAFSKLMHRKFSMLTVTDHPNHEALWEILHMTCLTALLVGMGKGMSYFGAPAKLAEFWQIGAIP